MEPPTDLDLDLVDLELEPVDEREPERLVLAWRLTQLLRGGYDDDQAIALAVRSDVDLHRALALTARGCPPATAVRILV